MVKLEEDWKDTLEEGTTDDRPFELAAVVFVAPVEVV